MDRTISPFHAPAAAPATLVPAGCATRRVPAAPPHRARPTAIDSSSMIVGVSTGPAIASPAPVAGPRPARGR